MNATQSLGWVPKTLKRCQGNTTAFACGKHRATATVSVPTRRHTMRRVLLAVAMTVAVLGVGGAAQASVSPGWHGIATARPGLPLPKVASTPIGHYGSYCQYDVSRGVLTVTSQDYPAGYTSSRVTYRGEIRAEYHGYLTAGVWTQEIGPWFTNDDMKVWVHGIPCAQA